ncbi:single-stranded DNA-binding protein [Algoriphagus sp. D3-2-R+10]|uniref:single-stranded DNA-binding protein n=1 Tax=Algoriphagus aurantiacus TaxID=3103948 RepID=UPI002B3924B1|nr:single-stranded DNA-binding protein [Algoriphagus sp. D3-2-R+10]MEB2773897.1 single-stranded DNA-binding protein [Algoriphagus sp. D3-2-R+10]
MAGVNKVILVGNLGADPEVKYLEGDNTVANLRLATTEAYKNRNGERVEQTEWHDLEMWGAQAKIAEQYLKKGSQIYVEGKIKTDSWQDEQGQNRYRTKIRVLSFTMLGSKPDGAGSSGSPQQSTQQRPASAAPTSAPKAQEMVSDTEDDDLPF